MAIKGKEVSPRQIGTGSNSSILDVPLLDPKRNLRKIKKDSLLLPLKGEIRVPGITLCSMGKNRKTKGLGRLGIKKKIFVLQSTCGKISMEIDHNK